jgi:2-methylcitrate dehydratase
MQFTSDAIGEYAEELSYDQLSDDAVDAAKQLVMDSLGCCLGAYSSPPSKYLRTVYGDLGGGEEATVFGERNTTLLEYAGLINATMVRYLDYNDAYISEGRACHPSDHIPALISAAEVEGRTGEELIEAIVLAYEIEGMGLDDGASWEQELDYVVWGSYSTAASVGKLMGLSREELVNAIGIAGTSNLALSIARKGEVSMWKGVAHPYVTHNAIQACQMARASITGPEEVIEGPGGFEAAAAKRELSVDRIGGRDGAHYRITDAHIKPFPCGYYMQPMIAGVRDLVEEHDIDPDAITEMNISTFEQAATILGGEEKWSTDLTRESADHSIPYTAAIAVLHSDVNPQHYGPTYRKDEEVHRLMQTVSVEENEEMNKRSVENPDSTPSVIEVVADGERYETHVDYAPGHAQNPLSREDLEEKFVGMADSLLTGEQIEDVFELCDNLDRLDRVDPVLEALVI